MYDSCDNLTTSRRPSARFSLRRTPGTVVRGPHAMSTETTQPSSRRRGIHDGENLVWRGELRVLVVLGRRLRGRPRQACPQHTAQARVFAGSVL